MSRSIPSLSLLGLCLAVAACGDPEPPPPAADAGEETPDAGAPEDAGTFSCPAGSRLTNLGTCQPVGWTTCSRGFERDPSGWGCAAILPALPCAPGSFPVLGETECQPVGPQACPTGFALDPGGWGCVAVVPTEPCAGGTYEKPGSTACAPIGDCAAPFPPPAATLFVDDDGPSDATHFTSLSAALAAAPAGATIAVDEGEYRESLTLSGTVTLVGRCAEKVVLQGSAAAAPGIVAGRRVVAEIRGLTVRGFEVGVIAEAGGALTLRDSLVEANRRLGLMAADSGTVVRAFDSAVRDNLPDGSDRFGQGVAAGYGARLELDGCAVVRNREIGILAHRPDTEVVLTRTLVGGTLPRGSSREYGWGVGVQTGARFEATDSAFVASRVAGLTATGAGSSLRLTGCTVDGVAPGLDNLGKEGAVGINVFLGANANLDRVTVIRSETNGVYLADSASGSLSDSAVVENAALHPLLTDGGLRAVRGASVEVARTAIVGNGAFGVLLQGSTATINDSLVAGTLGVLEENGNGPGVQLEEASNLTSTRLALIANSGMSATITDPNSVATLVQSVVIAPTPRADGVAGGFVAYDGGRVQLNGCLVRGAIGAGVVAEDSGSVAELNHVLIEDTATSPVGGGFGLAAQAGGRIEVSNAAVVRSTRVGVHVSHGSSQLVASNLIVRQTRPGDDGTRGRGVNVQLGGRADLTRAAILDSRQVGVFSLLADFSARDSLIATTLSDPGGDFGHGLFATASAVELRDVTVAGSEASALVFDIDGAGKGSALVGGCRLEANGVGLHVQGPDVALTEVASLPDSAGAGQIMVTTDTAFVDNGVRLGSGFVPLPPPIVD